MSKHKNLITKNGFLGIQKKTNICLIYIKRYITNYKIIYLCFVYNIINVLKFQNKNLHNLMFHEISKNISYGQCNSLNFLKIQYSLITDKCLVMRERIL